MYYSIVDTDKSPLARVLRVPRVASLMIPYLLIECLDKPIYMISIIPILYLR